MTNTLQNSTKLHRIVLFLPIYVLIVKNNCLKVYVLWKKKKTAEFSSKAANPDFFRLILLPLNLVGKFHIGYQ